MNVASESIIVELSEWCCGVLYNSVVVMVFVLAGSSLTRYFRREETLVFPGIVAPLQGPARDPPLAWRVTARHVN